MYGILLPKAEEGCKARSISSKQHEIRANLLHRNLKVKRGNFESSMQNFLYQLDLQNTHTFEITAYHPDESKGSNRFYSKCTKMVGVMHKMYATSSTASYEQFFRRSFCPDQVTIRLVGLLRFELLIPMLNGYFYLRETYHKEFLG